MLQTSTVKSITSHTSTPAQPWIMRLQWSYYGQVVLPSSQIAWEVWKDELSTPPVALVFVCMCCRAGVRLCQNTNLSTQLRRIMLGTLMQWRCPRVLSSAHLTIVIHSKWSHGWLLISTKLIEAALWKQTDQSPWMNCSLPSRLTARGSELLFNSNKSLNH